LAFLKLKNRHVGHAMCKHCAMNQSRHLSPNTATVVSGNNGFDVAEKTPREAAPISRDLVYAAAAAAP
jgi:hypothetical protein